MNSDPKLAESATYSITNSTYSTNTTISDQSELGHYKVRANLPAAIALSSTAIATARTVRPPKTAKSFIPNHKRVC